MRCLSLSFCTFISVWCITFFPGAISDPKCVMKIAAEIDSVEYYADFLMPTYECCGNGKDQREMLISSEKSAGPNLLLLIEGEPLFFHNLPNGLSIYLSNPVVVKTLGRTIFVKKLTNCKGFDNALINWSDVTLERDPTTKDFTFSVKLKVLKEVSTKFRMEFTVWKCDSAGSLDSCEYVIKEYRYDNICNLLAKKHQFWSVFVSSIEPALVCPIKPGNYSANKIPFKSDFLRILPIQDAVWRSRMKGFDNGKTISCAEMEVKVGKQRQG